MKQTETPKNVRAPCETNDFLNDIPNIKTEEIIEILNINHFFLLSRNVRQNSELKKKKHPSCELLQIVRTAQKQP